MNQLFSAGHTGVITGRLPKTRKRILAPFTGEWWALRFTKTTSGFTKYGHRRTGPIQD